MLTGKVPTIWLFVAMEESPQLAKGELNRCQNLPACAAARESDNSEFPDRRPI